MLQEIPANCATKIFTQPKFLAVFLTRLVISKITQHANKLIMAKHSLQLEKAILQDLLTDQKTLIKTKEFDCRCLIDNFIQSRWYTGRSITEKEILQTACVISSTHWEMETELEMMEQRI